MIASHFKFDLTHNNNNSYVSLKMRSPAAVRYKVLLPLCVCVCVCVCVCACVRACLCLLIVFKVALSVISSCAMILLQGTESWLLYFSDVLAVVWLGVFYVSFSRCRGWVCAL